LISAREVATRRRRPERPDVTSVDACIFGTT
jgi:hypothetical protein